MFPFNQIQHPHLDIYRSAKEIAENAGFVYQEHSVTTKDGYINSLVNLKNANKPVVLLIHGMIDSSDTWLMNDERSLGFLLHKAGYDVWMGNNRCNKYSQNHDKFDVYKDSAYWKGCLFHDMANFDTFAFIDAIL